MTYDDAVLPSGALLGGGDVGEDGATTMRAFVGFDDEEDSMTLPRHVAFICDGNSRWSRQRQSSSRRFVPRSDVSLLAIHAIRLSPWIKSSTPPMERHHASFI